MVRTSVLLVISLCISLLLVGCGNSGLPRTVPVSGTVTYQGKLVETGSVTFYAASGDRPGSGQLGPGGKFTLSTFHPNDGAVLGKHKVAIRAYKTTGDVSLGKGQTTELLVPVKYTLQDSPLEVEVKEGTNHFDLKLSD